MLTLTACLLFSLVCCVCLIQDTESPPPKGADQSKSQESKGNDEEVDIDLNDPEVANAATKIQAGFRGHKTRQELKDKMKVSILYQSYLPYLAT